MKLIYICGPYRSDSPWKKELNVRKAEELAVLVAMNGMMPVCPHSNTRPYFEGIQDDKFWLEGTLELLKRCDGIALIDGWKNSEGSRNEYSEALKIYFFENNEFVFYDHNLKMIEIE